MLRLNLTKRFVAALLALVIALAGPAIAMAACACGAAKPADASGATTCCGSAEGACCSVKSEPKAPSCCANSDQKAPTPKSTGCACVEKTGVCGCASAIAAVDRKTTTTIPAPLLAVAIAPQGDQPAYEMRPDDDSVLVQERSLAPARAPSIRTHLLLCVLLR